MPDAADYEADVIVDGQQRVLGRGTPRRSQAGDVLRLAGVVWMAPRERQRLPLESCAPIAHGRDS
jgi:hypothetical protein